MVFVVHHARSGVAALNVVTAALQAHQPSVRVVFARDREEMARALREHPDAIAGWSFYSPDFAAAAEDLA